MRELKIYWPCATLLFHSFAQFVQQCVNRLIFAQYRYGSPNARQRYLSRLDLEVKAYKKTGNREHLLNIANYAWLESEAPQHSKYHHDAGVESVTRGEFGV
jgi:hypothetical protein